MKQYLEIEMHCQEIIDSKPTVEVSICRRRVCSSRLFLQGIHSL